MHSLRFFVWPGIFIEEDESNTYTPGLFYIMPDIEWQYGPFIKYNTSTGANIYSHSFLFSIQLSHGLFRRKYGRIHYFISYGLSRVATPRNTLIDFDHRDFVMDPIQIRSFGMTYRPIFILREIPMRPLYVRISTSPLLIPNPSIGRSGYSLNLVSTSCDTISSCPTTSVTLTKNTRKKPTGISSSDMLKNPSITMCQNSKKTAPSFTP